LGGDLEIVELSIDVDDALSISDAGLLFHVLFYLLFILW